MHYINCNYRKNHFVHFLLLMWFSIITASKLIQTMSLTSLKLYQLTFAQCVSSFLIYILQVCLGRYIHTTAARKNTKTSCSNKQCINITVGTAESNSNDEKKRPTNSRPFNDYFVHDCRCIKNVVA